MTIKLILIKTDFKNNIMKILLIPTTLFLIMLFYVIFEMAFGIEKKENQDFKESMSKEEYDKLKKNQKKNDN